LDGAMTLHKEKERICRQQGNKDSLQKTLGSQAILLAANLGCAAEARGSSTRRDSNRFVDLDPQQRAMPVFGRANGRATLVSRIGLY
jgi:hypothetical protein